MNREERGRDLRFGLRLNLNADVPSLLDTEATYSDGQKRPFRFLSIPLYLVGQIRRLCREDLREEV